ncbi:E3 ubiquitin-protein ligase RNF169 [Latimeria chalumnae]|uniref:E3 ubiquitin-protein ligase RNF169 n=1 Tax=Latimeria chalumnae TaxID=7897 RepID=UPI0006D91D3D|nr:PREDICTED: E3 ubiquitin-protein ligase RNF169 [Latimeria chalumnae]|eukprot:XP_014351209.1 PREDICTED: E3 ubiquitin-protein ligase RNF169 [Latimeria chalumnae]
MAAAVEGKAVASAAMKRRKERGRHKRGEPAAAGAKKRARSPGPLPLEESVCPVCLEVFVEPVTLPCLHSLCLACFRRTVETASLHCPLCRTRVSTWARRHGRDNTLVDAELWQRVLRSHPERCRRRLREQRREQDGEERPGGPPAEEEFIFRAPIHLSKPGEVREEYESQMRKLQEEKNQEEKASKELINELLLDDLRGERELQEQITKDGDLKITEDGIRECFSDSENEEPSQGRSWHRSAFTSKNKSNLVAAVTSKLISSVERSQAQSDLTEESRPADRTKSALASNIPGSTLGILSSTENSRSFSAPDLNLDKRLAGSGPVLPTPALPQRGTERSISPESNDSISEELNHFKPIVCSPCTPPKRLPDGQLVSPTIIKSTPRNLSRSLHKGTSYEANPRILKKWEQILQDRQVERTTSKATLTFSSSETEEEDPVPVLDVVVSGDDLQAQQPGAELQSADVSIGAPLDLPSLRSQPGNLPHGVSGFGERGCESDTVTNLKTLSLEGEGKAALCNQEHSLTAAIDRFANHGDSGAHPANAPLDNTVSYRNSFHGSEELNVNHLFAEGDELGHPVRMRGGHERELNSCEAVNKQIGTRHSVDGINGKLSSSARKGRKRYSKTKHLEQNHCAKKRRHTGAEHFPIADSLALRPEQSLQQEEEDWKMAAKLQRKFDQERNMVTRHKGSQNEYYLRSWNASSSN